MAVGTEQVERGQWYASHEWLSYGEHPQVISPTLG